LEEHQRRNEDEPECQNHMKIQQQVYPVAELGENPPLQLPLDDSRTRYVQNRIQETEYDCSDHFSSSSMILSIMNTGLLRLASRVRQRYSAMMPSEMFVIPNPIMSIETSAGHVGARSSYKIFLNTM